VHGSTGAAPASAAGARVRCARSLPPDAGP
jgi:hypothetical protein